MNNYYGILSRLKSFNERHIPKEIRQLAFKLCKKVDVKDTVFVAATLALDAHLWTGDKKLKKGLEASGFAEIKTTEELLLK